MPLGGLNLALRLIVAALVAGVFCGGLVTVLQATKTEPLIRAAEVYEHAAPGTGKGADHASHAEDEWEPAEGFERWSYTLLANALAATGYALLLLGAYAIRRTVTWRNGILWGLGGFAAFALAPMLGLPPSLPGTELADITARQAWWIGTALASAAGLALLVFVPRPALKAVGIVLLVLPHVIGAPEPSGLSGVPAEIAVQFASATLLTNLLLWLALGAMTGLAFERYVATSSA